MSRKGPVGDLLTTSLYISANCNHLQPNKIDPVNYLLATLTSFVLILVTSVHTAQLFVYVLNAIVESPDSSDIVL